MSKALEDDLDDYGDGFIQDETYNTDDTRACLAPFFGKRVEATAIYKCTNKAPGPNPKLVSLCVEIKVRDGHDEVAVNHTWVQYSDTFVDLEEGAHIHFLVRVGEYINSRRERAFSLEHPTAVRSADPTALDPSSFSAYMKRRKTMADTAQHPQRVASLPAPSPNGDHKPESAKPADDPISLILDLDTFAKRCGGYDRLIALASVLKR